VPHVLWHDIFCGSVVVLLPEQLLYGFKDEEILTDCAGKYPHYTNPSPRRAVRYRTLPFKITILPRIPIDYLVYELQIYQQALFRGLLREELTIR
jgi:hypothetical protein